MRSAKAGAPISVRQESGMNLGRSIWTLPPWMACSACLLWGASVHLWDGTPVKLRLKADLTTEHSSERDRVDFVVAEPVTVQGVIVIPAGADAWGAVQSVNPKKGVWFDIEGVRLPNLTTLKLRSVAVKPKNSGKDQLKGSDRVGSSMGAPRGEIFTGYVDEDTDVLVAAGGASPASAAASSPGAVVESPSAATAPTSGPTPAATSPSRAPAPQTAKPNAPPPAPPVISESGDRVTLECYSDPSGADILLDGEFVGNTPSILKVSPASHGLTLELSGYKSNYEVLNLNAGTRLTTVRRTLEKIP